MFRNLLPQDTRAIELASAGGLLLVSMGLCCGLPLEQSVTELYSSYFWAVIVGGLGAFQLLALTMYARLELLRCITALIAGSLWVWVALSSLKSHPYPADLGVLVLGISNLYGFTVTFLFLKKSWEN